MRESDDRAVQRAWVYVETRAGAMKEGGDVALSLANGSIGEGHVIADLFELARGQKTGRLPGDATSITLFKSVGDALEDGRSRTGVHGCYGSISAPAFFSASISAVLRPASASTARESAPCSGAIRRIAGGVRLMRIGGSTIMISPSLG